MNGLSKWKVTFYLVAIFAAGTVSGWVVATKMAKRTAFKAPQPREIATSFRDRLHSKLSLNPDQARQIDAIIERSSAEIQALHNDNIKRIKQGLSNRNSQISALLTGDQQIQFDQMEKERQESWRGKDGWRGKGRGRGGDASRDKRPTDNAADRTPGDNPANDPPGRPQ